MSAPSTPTWEVGQKIGWWDSNAYSGNFGISKIVRIGKRDVVLEDGQRFRVTDKNPINHSAHTWGPARYFRLADDPEFTSNRRRINVHRIERNAEVAVNRFRKEPTREKAEAVIATMARWIKISEEDD